MKSLIKFLPILAFVGMLMGGNDILIAAPTAVVLAALVAMFVQKHSFQTVLDNALSNVKEMVMIFFIIMVAYALAEVLLATGVGASIITAALKFGITARTIAITGFLVTCILSIATGTSWGTFAACAPVFLWLNYIVGGNVVLTACAIAGGACFGDNIGLISDTTVLSSGIQNVQVIDRIRHQGVWSLLCASFSAIAFFAASILMGLPNTVGDPSEAINSITPEAWQAIADAKPVAVTLLEQVQDGVPLYMIIPLIIVIGLAIKGVQTLLCLGAGIVSSLFLGIFAGTVTSLSGSFDLITGGFSTAGSWTILMIMWVAAFGGIMNSINAFEPLAKLVVKFAKNIRHLMFSNALLCLIGNFILGDEIAEIVTMSPVIKSNTYKHVKTSEENMYKLRLRNATFADALGVYGSQLIPWHVFIIFYTSMANAVFPLYEFQTFDLIKYNFMAMIAVVSILVLTVTGLDRFVPLFGLPRDSEVEIIEHPEDDLEAQVV
ncbi:Na+/H+ antiporter NhaC family protein [Acidaminobacter sp. JC074]|uniref:Na+/H+ antiporter NhaC family protein n=1 Tax=Acidaminobacter sp. JC074 TaxID=2530199 RepID=UPI001F0E0ED9|nr:Na+/H+ antiporter NhaC family protein [Acidaminobacter sp. JC074]MCH4890328.1 Na+/H+ antiporter NhaC family protein [Acidaminobacter sp. JC074]